VVVVTVAGAGVLLGVPSLVTVTAMTVRLLPWEGGPLVNLRTLLLYNKKPYFARAFCLLRVYFI
jgi:hypothetical protein